MCSWKVVLTSWFWGFFGFFSLALIFIRSSWAGGKGLTVGGFPNPSFSSSRSSLPPAVLLGWLSCVPCSCFSSWSQLQTTVFGKCHSNEVTDPFLQSTTIAAFIWGQQQKMEQQEARIPSRWTVASGCDLSDPSETFFYCLQNKHFCRLPSYVQCLLNFDLILTNA